MEEKPQHVINFKPAVKQAQVFDLFNDDVTTEVTFGGSLGAGKSYVLASLLVMKSLQYPGIRIGLGRNSLTTLKKTTVVTILEVLSNWHLTSEHYVYNAHNGIIKFTNGSEIILVELAYLPSDPQYTRLGGQLFTFSAIDESTEVTEKAKEIFQSRSGRWKNEEFGLKPFLLMTTNPSRSSFIYRNVYKPYKENRLRSHQAFIPALPSDNPFLPKGYVENLMQTMSHNEIRRLIYGEWELEDDPTGLFKAADVLNMYDTSVILTTDKTRRLSADVAFTADKCVLVVWEGLNVLKIITQDKTTDQTLIDLIKMTMLEYEIRTDNICWDADGVGKFLKQHFPSGKEINNNGKTVVEHGYINLKTELYFRFSYLLGKGHIKMYDTLYMKELDEEFAVIKHKPKENMTNKIELVSKADMKRQLGRSPDYADALAYGMIFHLQQNYVKASDFTFISF